MLAEHFVSDEAALVAIPAHLNYDEAATLSCAGITAWNALFADGGLRPGATVVLLGTGGVSIIALQLAHAAGCARSSRRRAMRSSSAPAHSVRTPPSTIARRPNGSTTCCDSPAGGADLVVEVGGKDTLPRSVAATKLGGIVSVIGGLSSFAGPEPGCCR